MFIINWNPSRKGIFFFGVISTSSRKIWLQHAGWVFQYVLCCHGVPLYICLHVDICSFNSLFIYASTKAHNFKIFIIHFIRNRFKNILLFFFYLFSLWKKNLRAEKHGQDFIKFGTCGRNECRTTKALKAIVLTGDNEVGGGSALGELSCHDAAWWLST